MATQAGLNRVAQINATIAKQGQAAPNPMGGQNYPGGSGGGSNPKDAPGYVAGSSPTDSQASQTALATSGVKPTPIPEQPIDTSQPSPQTAQIAPPNAQVSQSTQATPEQVAAVAKATQQVNDLSSQYKQGLATAKATGVAPSSQGQAANIVQQALPQSQNEANIMADIVDTEPGFTSSILEMWDEVNSPEVQKTSLVEEYQNLSKSLGIEQLNTDLLNAKNVIEGTEDDIRNEVVATGGMATDSQVMALANARNKSLIKNYNNLLATRDNAMTQLSTMMQLTVQDRQMASAEFDRKLNFVTKTLEFRDKALSNAREGYNSVISNVGYNGLLESLQGNSYQIGIVEKTLGLGQGGLQKIANMPPTLEDKYKQAQIDKIYSDIATSGGAGVDAAQTLAYAQQYAATGQIPTGLPKGTFGTVAQVAKELPKTKGQILSVSTGVSPNGDAALQTAMGSLTSSIELAKQLKELDKKRWGGLVSGTLGKVFGDADQQRYVDLRAQIVDLLGRARSGAALNAAEESRYNNMIPGRFSNAFFMGPSSQTKIDNFISALTNDVSNKASSQGWAINGLSKVKVGETEFTVGDIISNGTAQGRVNADGSITLIQ